MTVHRWSKFWWQDWQRDPALRACSIAARGLWMDMLAIAHQGTPRGHVTINGKAATAKQIARVAGISDRECDRLLAEMEDNGVFSRTGEGVIYSRRMVRDTEASDRGKALGATGGNPALKANKAATVNGGGNPEGLTPPLMFQEAEADTEEEREPPFIPPSPAAASPAKPAPPNARGCRLPDDFEANLAFPADLGLDGLAELAKFRDYWAAQPGTKGRKTDWQATWRNWCRKAAENHAYNARRSLQAPEKPQFRNGFAAMLHEEIERGPPTIDADDLPDDDGQLPLIGAPHARH